jgi:excinuclease ABC subunit B
MFKLHSEYTPAGDQPQAIEKLVQGLNGNDKFQTLLGVTGSRENLYYGKCNRESAKTYSCSGT